jgi:hypothetical protein
VLNGSAGNWKTSLVDIQVGTGEYGGGKGGVRRRRLNFEPCAISASLSELGSALSFSPKYLYLSLGP